MSAAPRHSVSVAAAIVDDADRLLAIRRADNGHWEPPGGVLELKESIEDGLAREVLEETGLRIEVERLSGVYKNMARGIVALVFRCRVAGGELTRNAEVVDWRWLSRDEVSRELDQAYAVRLLDALEAGPPAVRSHDGQALLQQP
jgi:8-oxo-dGTP diphosphatase